MQVLKQYNNIKAKYPDAIILIRVNDFYETVKQDAINASLALGTVLTKSTEGYEITGFPAFSLDNHLPKLIRAGYRVAIVDKI